MVLEAQFAVKILQVSHDADRDPPSGGPSPHLHKHGTATQGLFPLGKGSALMPGHTHLDRISFSVVESI